MQPYFLLMVFFIFILTTYIFTYKNKWAWLIFFAIIGHIIPLVTILAGVEHNWFIWGKYFLLVEACLVVGIMKYTSIIPERYFSGTVVFILFINIAEAVLRNGITAYLGSADSAFPFYFFAINTFCGLLVIITLCLIHPTVCKEPKDKAFKVDLPIAWIVAYLSWNWTFIFLEWPDYAGIQTAVILSSIIPALFLGRLLWFEARAITITAGLMYNFMLGDNYINYLMLNYHPNMTFTTILSSVNVLLAVYAFYSVCLKKHNELNDSEGSPHAT